MKNYNTSFIKHEDINWNWYFDPEKKIHKLTIYHTPSKKSVVGEIAESKNAKKSLFEKKKDLYDSLILKLESMIFD